MSTITVRYFAAARAATGLNEERIELPVGTSLAQLLRRIEERHGDALAQVLRRSSFLLDEIAVRDIQCAARPGSTLDVLPPFAGG